MKVHRKYLFSQEQLTYTPVKKKSFWWISRAGAFILACFILGGAGFFLISGIIETPSEKNLKAQNERLRGLFVSLDNRLDQYGKTLEGMQILDDSIYRLLVGTDPLPFSIRNAGTGGNDQTAVLNEAGYQEQIIETADRILNLQSGLKIQHNSYLQVYREALANRERLKHLPSIMPIFNNDLLRTGAGFGMRLHPILNIYRMHKGMDFLANEGTQVFATADGKVKKCRYSETYGNVIEIDHGYGLITLYAHLSKMSVQKGEQVVRGQDIGYVGNTGLSTGSHLHYEVHVNGAEVDPVKYYFQDLSPEEYEMIVSIAQSYEKSMD